MSNNTSIEEIDANKIIEFIVKNDYVRAFSQISNVNKALEFYAFRNDVYRFEFIYEHFLCFCKNTNHTINLDFNYFFSNLCCKGNYNIIKFLIENNLINSDSLRAGLLQVNELGFNDIQKLINQKLHS